MACLRCQLQVTPSSVINAADSRLVKIFNFALPRFFAILPKDKASFEFQLSLARCKFLKKEEGSFQRTMRALDYLSKYKINKLSSGINSVIFTKNLDDIIKLSEGIINNRNLGSIYFITIIRPFGSDLDWHWLKK